MKRVSDFLSAIFDTNTQEKIKNSSKLFSAWEQLAGKHGIASAAFHSRIQDIQKGVLQVEADHPGWVQILQTKIQPILLELQEMFPELGISGIAIKLSKPLSEFDAAVLNDQEQSDVPEIPEETPASVCSPAESAYERIKDQTLVENLKSLEETLKNKKR